MSLIEVTCVHLAVHMRQDATCDVAPQEIAQQPAQWEAPTGSSSGPGGCTNEMLKVCLDNTEALHLLTSAAEDFARSSVTKLHLPGVHDGYDDGPSDNLKGASEGSQTSTSFRRLVAKTLAKQFMVDVEQVCAPFRSLCPIHAETDCAGHAVRAVTDLDPEMTVLSICGIGPVITCIGVLSWPRWSKYLLCDLLLFVRQTYARESTYWWADEDRGEAQDQAT